MIEKIKEVLEGCSLLAGMPVAVDYIHEKRPCVGLFPAGEQEVFREAGAVGRAYSFTLQLVGYAFDEEHRQANEGLLEGLCRWAEGVRPDLGEGTFRKLALWGGKLLYPGQDGQTCVYELTGKLVYEAAEEESGGFGAAGLGFRWYFGLGWPDALVWAECAAGIQKVEVREADEVLFYGFDGGVKEREVPGERVVVFSGRYCPDDRFQQLALRRRRGRWACCPAAEAGGEKSGWGGDCLVSADLGYDAGQQEPVSIRVEARLLSAGAGTLWLDGESGGFLPRAEERG